MPQSDRSAAVTYSLNIPQHVEDFVGSNNLNLLVPSGQFGTRAQGGKAEVTANHSNSAITWKYVECLVGARAQQAVPWPCMSGCRKCTLHLHEAGSSGVARWCVTLLGCRLATIARLLFNPLDDPILDYQALGGNVILEARFVYALRCRWKKDKR